MKVQPCVAEYDYIDINERSQLIAGDAAATVTYSGEAIYLSSIDTRIEYVLPDDRTIVWFDHYTIPSSSARREQAYRFLDFMNRPANAARLAETLSIISPNQAARELLPEELKQHPALTPPQGTATLVEQPRDARTVRLINSLSSELISDAGTTP